MQHVNLYQRQFRPHRDPTDAFHLALALVLVLLALVVFSGYQAWQARQAQQRLADERAEQQSVQQRMDALRSELQSAQASDTDASQQLEQLRREYEAKQRLLQFLDQGPLADEAGFAGHLAGLAERIVDGVWLERIQVKQGGGRIRLDGHALEAPQIPAFIASLGRAPVYAGRTFRTLRVQRQKDDGGPVAFVLASNRVDLAQQEDGKR